MGKWKYTATTRDKSGNAQETIVGEVSGPHPGGAPEAVRKALEEREPSAYRVDVDMDDPYFD